MSTSTLWKGQISCWVKTSRSSCHFLPIYNYSKSRVFRLRGTRKPISALYSETLTGKITETHDWGHRGGRTRRKHDHSKRLCADFESTRAVSSSASINTNTQEDTRGLSCAILPVHTVIWLCMVSSVMNPFYVCSLKKTEKIKTTAGCMCVNQFIIDIQTNSTHKPLQLQPGFH